MEVVGEVGVGLQLAEVGQGLLESPLVVPHGRPVVEVFGNAPEEDLHVDGAGAAGDLAPGDVHRLGDLGGLGDEVPVVLAGGDVGTGGVPVPDLLRQAVEVRNVRAGLQQQH